jgi:isopentenyldiphosphate isomerase
VTEYFDVLAEDGTPTGESLPRDEVHNYGLWHGSVHAWIVNSRGEFLLQQRAFSKKTDPGLWDVAVAGHISAGDNAITTTIREAQEELGLALDRDGFDVLFTYTHHNEHPLANGSIRHERLITPTLLMQADVDLATLTLEPSEVAAVRWIGLDELHAAVTDPPHDFAIRPDEWAQLFPLLRDRLSLRV